MQQQSSGAFGALTLGQRLEIGFGEDTVEWLASRIEDHDGSGERVTVAWPTDHERRQIPVKPGQTVQLAASTPQDAMYAARAEVEVASREGVPLLTLRVSGAWQRVQRRNAVRVAVAIRPRSAEIVFGETRKQLRLGVTDISALGVQVRSQDELRSGDHLDLAFELMDVDEEIQVKARVRRVNRQERATSVIWDAGCEFEGLSAKLGQRIVQFIFARQRALARAKRGSA
jgi:c-di-GMP-binding flagellar brake protein YcgR